ncbi:TonB-dependent receptor [Phascolarctobacterium sp.]|uniref:TonB-dependent receptor n=1 Tax=Phascolarctobacterium sp. TaxID=2049039 RepID=UPI00386FDCF8
MANNAKLRNFAFGVALALGCSALGSVQIAFAEETIPEDGMDFALEEITVQGKRPIWEEKLSPGSVDVIRTEDFKGEQKTLADMLLTVPGLHVREVNGKGQYTTVTVRGSTAAQVGIFIDGVLANLGGDSAVDLSTIPVKNVERIEVYRGYVPSRFGGTFIGGVINIVTKKPETTNVSLEVGKSSYGGRKGSLELTAPAGAGSLMVGVNYESSDGDFKYKNYAAEHAIPTYESEITTNQDRIDNFDAKNIDNLVNGNVVSLSQDQIAYFKSNSDAWLGYVRDSSENGLNANIKDNKYNYYASQFENDPNKLESQFIAAGIKDQYIAAIDQLNQMGENFKPEDWFAYAQADWNSNGNGEIGLIDAKDKNEFINDYANANIDKDAADIVADMDPETSKTLAGCKDTVEKNKDKLKKARDAYRWRQYNDYENGSAIIKWQNADWVIKGTYNKIDRHLPDGVWGGDVYNAPINNAVDVDDKYYYDSRRQKVESTGLMLQNRKQTGKLEIGWLVDYLHQDKNYRAEHINLEDGENYTQWDRENTPFREWSEYTSDKYNFQVDGSYQLSAKSMLDFQMNYSTERMDVDGSNLNKLINDENNNNPTYAGLRNRYDQEIFNIQLQNSITLDDKGDWVLTPGIRYNQSKITGYSSGKNFENNQFKWVKPKESQTDGKATWQLALKKRFDDRFTLRSTGGTYYRLLNMSEIAGDGAGILPSPSNSSGSGSTFPVPEQGKQFDVSAIMSNKFLGADNDTILTYFWRDSENMLQLVRKGKDYWCYFNDNKGTVRGVELQSNFKWSKFDLEMQVTYQKPEMERMNSAVNYDYAKVWATYQPEWEGNIRLTYNPSEKVSMFTEAHYTDEYFTDSANDAKNSEDRYLSGKPVTDLTVINTGLKLKPASNWQLTFGCNDIFNEAPKAKIRVRGADWSGYVNNEFPIQGRTFYFTAKYDF